MTERPILFAGPLVRRIRSRDKTETRRLVTKRTSLPVSVPFLDRDGGFDDLDWDAHEATPEDGTRAGSECSSRCDGRDYCSILVDGCPGGLGGFGCGQYLHVPGTGGVTRQRVHSRVEPGDVLYVRESYRPRYFDGGRHAYAADWDGAASGVVSEPKWTPSIHMPKSAARIHLRVTEVRAERLQEIDDAGARAEGIAADYSAGETDRHLFAKLWDSIYSGDQAWPADPWVWIWKFEMIDG